MTETTKNTKEQQMTHDGYELADMIVGGEHDDGELNAIVNAVKERRRQIREEKAVQNAGDLCKGDRVRIAGGIRPKYLIGVTGLVHKTPKIGDVRVGIDVDENSLRRLKGRFRETNLRVPLESLETV